MIGRMLQGEARDCVVVDVLEAYCHLTTGTQQLYVSLTHTLEIMIQEGGVVASFD